MRTDWYFGVMAGAGNTKQSAGSLMDGVLTVSKWRGDSHGHSSESALPKRRWRGPSGVGGGFGNTRMGEFMSNDQSQSEGINLHLSPTLFTDFVRKHQLAMAELTEQQLAEAIRQAIAAGDFVRYVRVDNSAQSVSYIPWRECERLRGELARVHKVLETLLSFALAEYYPNCTTPWYKEAVEAACKECGVEIPK